MKSGRAFFAFSSILLSGLFLGQTVNSAPADSLAVFQTDSAKTKTVRNLEAGIHAPDTSISKIHADSLDNNLRQRGIYLAVTAGLSFSNLSSKGYFSTQFDSTLIRDSLRVLQKYDPVHISFPVGILVGIPLFPYFDLWLRTDHFWYRPSALAQGTGPTREFWYAVQTHLFGLGARYMVPTALLSVNGRQGLYLAYSHFWNFGPTGIYAPTGSLRARMEPLGAGYEIQAGFQQNFDRRWVLTGGLAYSALSFKSQSSWRAILPTAPDKTAQWELNSMRLCFLGMYQFGSK